MVFKKGLTCILEYKMSFLLHGRSGSFGVPLLLVQRTYSCEVQESQEISDQGDL